MSGKIDNSDKLRKTILQDLMDQQAPSETGITYIKREVAEII